MARRIFRRKPKEEKKETRAQGSERTSLQELCEGDSELYNALSLTVFLNSEVTVQGGIDPYLSKAQEYEKNNDRLQARISYHVAGEIALYEGNLAQAQKAFKKAAEQDPKSPYQKAYLFFGDRANAEKALKVAQEFYVKTGKIVKT